jgi:hypothetical protein
MKMALQSPKHHKKKRTQPRKNEEAATAVRATRDKLIASCDWMAIKAFEGGTTVSTEWATYRQALRDVTAQEGFPNDITWPTQPE